MLTEIESSWKKQLSAALDEPSFKTLQHFVKEAYADSTKPCYPPIDQVFNAFDRCPFWDVRVVILGQDPYHGPGQANGLCFSVADGIRFPPSLVNIFEEIRRDTGKQIPPSGNLERWADQGVLLLNATLTVSEGAAGSHQKKGWEDFTDAVVSALSQNREHLVFLLWGNHAQKKGKNIDRSKHLVLTSGHPSPLSANRGKWFENRHFSQANAYLSGLGYPEIDW